MKSKPTGAAGPSALVLKASSMGDVIHTLPAVKALTQSFPTLAVRWLVNTEWVPLLENNHGLGLAEVIPFPRSQFRGITAAMKMKRWASSNLRHYRPDIAIDYQGLLRSAMLCKASQPEQIVGFAKAREGAPKFYSDALDMPDWDSLHAVDRYRRLSAFVDAKLPQAVDFPLPEGDPIPNFPLDEDQPFIVLHPFSRGAGKSLSHQEVANFCAAIPDRAVAIVGVGASWPHLKIPLPRNGLDLLGQTSLTQLIWLMRRATGVISVDSGPMHLATAVTEKVLSIHTWTNPRIVGPYKKDAHVWRDNQIHRVGDIAVDQFPEDRRSPYRKQKPGADLLPKGEIDRLAAFCDGRDCF